MADSFDNLNKENIISDEICIRMKKMAKQALKEHSEGKSRKFRKKYE